ncbi:RNA polymerase sigma factor [Nocardioides humi]|uniref:Sigma-70 family RNA polymerase sigma factor n=1 Tax=Nocardioides humi TaxID=449461 RepID=A0ABN2ANH5_9ACTN|nr:RNA polymerase sigma factor [Nocardioides humi]
MTGGDDEAERWRRAREGDADAFVTVYDAHRERVHGHALRLLGDVHDAEDVTAVAFLHLWRRRSDVRLVGGSVLPWLLVTAGHAARNVGRARRRHRRLLARLPRSEPVVSPADLAEAAGFSPGLAAAVSRLSAVDRSLVGLVVLAGLPLEEAAEAVGVTTGAAKTRMYRIRIRLRAELAPDQPIPAREKGAER